MATTAASCREIRQDNDLESQNEPATSPEYGSCGSPNGSTAEMAQVKDEDDDWENQNEQETPPKKIPRGRPTWSTKKAAQFREKNNTRDCESPSKNADMQTRKNASRAAERQKRCRQNKKNGPFAEWYREKERLRVRAKRLAMGPKTAKQIERELALARIRSQRYRERMKERGLTGSSKKKALTDSELLKRREYYKIQKRKSRARLAELKKGTNGSTSSGGRKSRKGLVEKLRRELADKDQTIADQSEQIRRLQDDLHSTDTELAKCRHKLCAAREALGPPD